MMAQVDHSVLLCLSQHACNINFVTWNLKCVSRMDQLVTSFKNTVGCSYACWKYKNHNIPHFSTSTIDDESCHSSWQSLSLNTSGQRAVELHCGGTLYWDRQASWIQPTHSRGYPPLDYNYGQNQNDQSSSSGQRTWWGTQQTINNKQSFITRLL